MPFDPTYGAWHDWPTVDTPITAAYLQSVDDYLGSIGSNVFNAKEYGAVGDGVTDDTEEIQAAIDAADEWGGRVYLPAGGYVVSAPLRIERDGVEFVGAGRGQSFTFQEQSQSGSVLIPSASFSGTAVVKVARPVSDTTSLSGVRLAHFCIAGFALPAGTVDGVYYECKKGSMSHVWVVETTGDGFHFEGRSFTDCYDNNFFALRSDNAGASGFHFEDDATDNFLADCIAFNATDHGALFEDQASGNTVNGCYFYSCAGKGIYSKTSHHQKFLNTRIQDVNGGIYLEAPSGADGGFVIEGGSFRNCSKTTDNTTDAINISSVAAATRGGLIAGNDFYADVGLDNGGSAPNKNRARYGINIADSDMRDVQIGVNSQGYNPSYCSSVFGTAFLNDSGTDTRILHPSKVTLDATAQLKFGSSGPFISQGTGTPEGVVTAPMGSLFLRTDGSTSTTLYVKTSGSGNTGWTAK